MIQKQWLGRVSNGVLELSTSCSLESHRQPTRCHLSSRIETRVETETERCWWRMRASVKVKRSIGHAGFSVAAARNARNGEWPVTGGRPSTVNNYR